MNAHYPELPYMNVGTEEVRPQSVMCAWSGSFQSLHDRKSQPNMAGTESSFTTMKLWEALSILKSTLWL